MLFIGLELLLHRLPLSEDRARFLFFTEYKISRWHYLNGLLNRLLIDEVLKTKPNHLHVEGPEPQRPPFDRVPYPYEIQTNSDGFRDAPFQQERTEKVRVLLLGDSVSFGKGVQQQERFAELLEQNLAIEVYNLGLQGCTAECQWRLLDRYLEHFAPDLLIIQASGNDLDQSLWKATYKKEIPGLNLAALEQIQKYRSLMELMRWKGEDRLQTQFTAALEATDLRYGSYIEQILNKAAEHNIPSIGLELPFAYGWSYGAHLIKRCSEQNLCRPLTIEFPPNEPVSAPDFVHATAKALNIHEAELAPVFPYRAYFHDVCHLSPKGHEVAHQQLNPLVSSLLK